MNDFCRGTEEDTPPTCANRGAEVDILRVHEKPLVHQPDRFSIGASHEEAGAADPVHFLWLARERLDIRADRPGLSAALDQKPLSELRKGRQHPAKGKLHASVRIDQTWADDRHVGSCVERRHEPVE
jgi:hypothetical protein